MILSFDIGIKNMAYAIVDEEQHIHDWALVSLDNKDIYSLCDSIISNCDSLFKDKPLTYVLIENQPCMKAPTMKSIQMILFTYFKINFKDANVLMCSAVNKLKVSKNPTPKTKLTYSEKKKMSIKLTRLYVEGTPQEQLFIAHPKKDDLADAYLQAVYFLEAGLCLPRTPCKNIV